MRRGAPVLLALLLLGACSFDYGGDSGTGQAAKPDVTFRDFSHVVVNGGAKVLELTAARAESYESQNLLVLTEVRFTQFERGSGKVSATGRADSARFHVDSEDAELSGNIVLTSVSEDAKLKAESLSWDGETKVLQGGIDRTVLVIKGDGTWIRGAGFQTDTRRRTLTFREAVEGSLETAADEASR